MSQKLRYLTKSRFKIGCECPSKLFYTGKKEYGDTKIDNSFLEALAEGGFQVGALAQLHFPGGVQVSDLDSSKAVAQTTEFLKKDSVTLFEPAVQFQNLLVRVDVLVKNNSRIDLIEVKAKSFDSSEENPFYNKTSLKKGKPKISSTWEPYLLDIAFQTYVVQRAFPQVKVTSSLMLADKTAVASVDGINQKFFLSHSEGKRVEVSVAPGVQMSDLGTPLLKRVYVDEAVQILFGEGINGVPFEECVEKLAKAYVADQLIPPKVGAQCKGCEFRIPEELKSLGKKSAFDECWTTSTGLKPAALQKPLVFDVWNFRQSEKLIAGGVYLMEDIQEEDVSPKPSDKDSGLSATDRQWLQISKTTQNDSKPYIDLDGLADEMSNFKYPLHFIDFETTMVAIPFNQGRRPYEQVAFQFSHHTLNQAGLLEHKTQYINQERGKFPNYDFVRNLKAALEMDDGTIFRFAAHENTVLCQIHDQLERSDEADREELTEWIRTVTKATGDRVNPWQGKRSIVDLCEMVKKYFYHPLTKGSNSIKKVLPAVLQESKFLQAKYSQPIYGTAKGPKSLNFKDFKWIHMSEDGHVKDPYKLLEPVFTDLDLETMESFVLQNAEDASIADGGAAMTAYARMQFTQMSETECDRVRNALLKYCELDTFAMVLIYEYWSDLVKSHTAKKAA